MGEQGNRGMNWDPRSALRMRIRAWTALFQEVALVFWNTNWSKAGMFRGHDTPDGVANIYLGPEERGDIRVLQQYASRLDAGLHMVPVDVNDGQAVRAYGLSSPHTTGVYLHHFGNHATRASGVRVTLVLPLEASWVAESHPTLSVEDVADGGQRVVLVVSEERWLERLLLQLGAGATVTDPPEYRDLAARAARRVLARYRE